jgi:predicted nucleic acid-binding protein
MDSVLVDTDVLSFAVKRDTRAALYANDIQGKLACVALMTVAELHCWPIENRWGRAKTERLERAIDSYALLMPDHDTARLWAQVLVARKRVGRPMLPGDCWIAATALRHGIPLITHNSADYQGVAGLKIITHTPGR